MDLSLLYNFIIHPIDTLVKNKAKTPKREALLVVGLISLSSLKAVGILIPNIVLPLLIIVFMGYCVGFMLQGLAIDFLTQWFKGKSQSLKTISWLILATVPVLGLVPLDIVSRIMGYPFSLAYQFLVLPLSIFSVILQINVVKVLYNFSSFKSFCIYIGPFIIPIIILFCWVILLVSGTR